MAVTDVARVVKCSRWSVYLALANDELPSQRKRRKVARHDKKRISARRMRVEHLIKRIKVVKAARVVKRPGRPRNDGKERPSFTITRDVAKLQFPSPAAVSRELCHSNLHVSRSTIYRDLCALGLKAYNRPKRPRITEASKSTRVDFCKRILQHESAWFKRLIFTDEKWFDSNDTGVRFQYLRRSEKSNILPIEFVQSPPKVFVFGAIGVKFRFISFVVYEGKGMQSGDYERECINKMKCPARSIVQQDNATCHLTAQTKAAWERKSHIGATSFGERAVG